MMMSTFHVVARVNVLFAYYKVVKKDKPQRIISEIHVGKSLAWGYFDGAC
jgi:hypothetical protein